MASQRASLADDDSATPDCREMPTSSHAIMMFLAWDQFVRKVLCERDGGRRGVLVMVCATTLRMRVFSFSRHQVLIMRHQ
jgi:hypothetical protein